MVSKKTNTDLTEIAELLAVVDNQATSSKDKMGELHGASSNLKSEFTTLLDEGDDILAMLDNVDLLPENEKSILGDSFDDLMSELVEPVNAGQTAAIKTLNIFKASGDYTDTLINAREYAEKEGIDLSNPYYAGMSQLEINNINRILSEKYQLSALDKYDYAFAGIVGIVMGLVDVFLVGSITDGNKNSPGQGWLGKKVDSGYETLVKNYAKFEYAAGDHRGPTPNFDNKSAAIRWLENAHKVSYDAANNAHVIDGVVKGMNPSNHHLMSLAHDSGILGLIIGVLDQLTGKATFIDADGNLLRVATDSFENANVTNADGVEKVINAVTNWFGHTMSDISGASGSKGRGAGLPGPFYSLTQELHFGSFDVNGKDMDVAQLSEWLYKQGLDVRALTTQAIPVVVAEVLVRVYWLFKKHFYYGKSWKESMPLANADNPDLQKMLLTSMAAFETLDIADALARGGLTPKALLSINFVGLVDLSFRSIQVLRSHHRHLKLLNELDDDLQAEWNRIYRS